MMLDGLIKGRRCGTVSERDREWGDPLSVAQTFHKEARAKLDRPFAA